MCAISSPQRRTHNIKYDRCRATQTRGELQRRPAGHNNRTSVNLAVKRRFTQSSQFSRNRRSLSTLNHHHTSAAGYTMFVHVSHHNNFTNVNSPADNNYGVGAKMGVEKHAYRSSSRDNGSRIAVYIKRDEPPPDEDDAKNNTNNVIVKTGY
ncbi:hypothetical protein QTP88_022341 [Uroleucon formosanum]